MADKKNLVIKLKYPAGVKKHTRYSPPAEKVTEWDMRRVAVALLMVVFVVVVSLYLLFLGKAQPTDKPSVHGAARPIAPISPVIEPELAQPATEKGLSALAADNMPTTTTASAQPKDEAQAPIAEVLDGQKPSLANVSRALLTFKIKKRHPMTEIPRLVRVGEHRAVVVHYFTELEGMAGQVVFHEWLLNGEVIRRYTLNVEGEQWPTFSRMVITGENQGTWAVRLLDENNQLLNQQTFTVANP